MGQSRPRGAARAPSPVRGEPYLRPAVRSGFGLVRTCWSRPCREKRKCTLRGLTDERECAGRIPSATPGPVRSRAQGQQGPATLGDRGTLRGPSAAAWSTRTASSAATVRTAPSSSSRTTTRPGLSVGPRGRHVRARGRAHAILCEGVLGSIIGATRDLRRWPPVTPPTAPPRPRPCVIFRPPRAALLASVPGDDVQPVQPLIQWILRLRPGFPLQFVLTLGTDFMDTLGIGY